MPERRFNREIERLRDPERVARLEVERAVDLALKGLDGARTVLDVGTGSALFAEKFAARGLQVSGLDANTAMLPAAREFVPGGIFQEGIAERLPFPDACFDLIFMGLVLHETDDLSAAIKEAQRVATRRLAVLEWPPEAQAFGPPLDHRLAVERVRSLAMEAGFREVRTVRLKNFLLYLAER
jgi:ubiquinone/menaquinone biosynthesis C-methylase UbiE